MNQSNQSVMMMRSLLSYLLGYQNQNYHLLSANREHDTSSRERASDVSSFLIFMFYFLLCTVPGTGGYCWTVNSTVTAFGTVSRGTSKYLVPYPFILACFPRKQTAVAAGDKMQVSKSNLRSLAPIVCVLSSRYHQRKYLFTLS